MLVGSLNHRGGKASEETASGRRVEGVARVVRQSLLETKTQELIQFRQLSFAKR